MTDMDDTHHDVMRTDATSIHPQSNDDRGYAVSYDVSE